MWTSASWRDRDLVEELYSLARTRTVGEFRRSRFPALSDLCGAPRQGFDFATGLPRYGWDGAIATAISRIPDPRHREAAEAIFGSHARRWTSLRERQSLAAEQFGVGYDAYRRRRRNGLSLYEETVSELASSIETLAPAYEDEGRDRLGAVRVGSSPHVKKGEVHVNASTSMPARDGNRELRLRVTDDGFKALQTMAINQNLTLGELIRRALITQEFLFAHRDQQLFLVDQGNHRQQEIEFHW
jgi:hypothetical protein